MRTITFPFTYCRFGIAQRDVTPPVGIYARSWGAASHDAAEGVHRPCMATAAVLAPLMGDEPMLAIVGVDLGWFQHLQDERDMRASIMQRTGLSEANLLINLSHTHASANANSQLADVEGAELIKPYLAHLTNQIVEAIHDARHSLASAWIAYGYGRCALAQNRDYWDEAAGRFACGYNPRGEADDTLLVARVTDEVGRVRGILFNYACHPTTLAWQNRLLSPDYIGAAREVLERAYDAPALFLQGASGELAPRDNYVGDAAIADRNGRQLGYAAAATIEALPPPASQFIYTGIMPSGADLGTWAYESCDDVKAAEVLQAQLSSVQLPRKALPLVAELEAQLAANSNRREQELIRRRLFIQRTLGDEPVHQMPLWVWRLGQAALVAIPNEAYSLLQTTLRQQFADMPLFVLGVTNGTLGYLPPKDLYGKGIYQEQQSPYAPGCLEQTIETAAHGLKAILM